MTDIRFLYPGQIVHHALDDRLRIRPL